MSLYVIKKRQEWPVRRVIDGRNPCFCLVIEVIAIQEVVKTLQLDAFTKFNNNHPVWDRMRNLDNTQSLANAGPTSYADIDPAPSGYA